MAISSGSSATARGGVPSSSSSDSSAMAHTGKTLVSRLSFDMCFANKSPVACSSLAFSTASRQFVVAVGTQAMPSSCPHLVLLARVRDCASCPFGRRLSSPCLVHDHVVERAVEDGAGKSGARLRPDAALEAAESGHVAGLQVRRASCWDEAQHDVRESGLHGGQWWPRWRGCWPCLSEGSTIVLPCMGSARRPRAVAGVVVVVAQPFSDVT